MMGGMKPVDHAGVSAGIVMARRVLTCTQCTASGAMAIGRERGVRL